MEGLGGTASPSVPLLWPVRPTQEGGLQPVSAEPNKAAVEAEDVVVLNGPGSLLSTFIVLPLAIHAASQRPAPFILPAAGPW